MGEKEREIIIFPFSSLQNFSAQLKEMATTLETAA